MANLFFIPGNQPERDRRGIRLFWKNFDPQEMKRLIDENLEGFYQDKDLVQRQKEYAHSFSYEKHFKEYQNYIPLFNL